MHAFTSLSNRREEQDMSICINGRITKKKREKKTSNMPVSLLFVHVRACVYMCDIGKIRVVY
jgi:hypothetical protein